MSIRLAEGSGVPYWRQIRDELADRIRSGQLAPGSPLPSIRELAVETLVSVITVKKAYEELERANLVYSHQGRGTFVADQGGAASRQVLLAEIAAELASAAKRARDAGLTPAEIDDLWRAAVAAP